jgi:hypothetical protein
MSGIIKDGSRSKEKKVSCLVVVAAGLPCTLLVMTSV